MTFEQKVEKLRGIIDKKIAIRCENKEDAEKLFPLLNEITNEDYNRSEWYLYEEDTCYEIQKHWNYGAIDSYRKNNYQIIPYSEFFADKIKDKPLGEWTLNEVKEYCDKFTKCKNCDDCVFYKSKRYDLCMFDINPYDWDFTTPNPSLTQSEIGILKAIKVLYPLNNNLTLKYVDKPCGFSIYPFNIFVGLDRLPSLSHDKEYNIDKLLEGVN